MTARPRIEDALEILDRLVSFDTTSDRSNLELIAWVEARLKAHGVACAKSFDAAGNKAAIFATFGPDVDGGVVLSGHVDTVPVAGQPWTSDPFKLREAGGRLHARGATDMKGFDALALAAAPAFLGAKLARPVHLLLSYDEEINCLGPVDLIRRFGVDLPKPAFAIVGEPTSMRVADAQKSISTYVTRATGVEAHSARPSMGANAVSAAVMLAAALDEIGDDFAALGPRDERFDPPHATVHVGLIAGGTARNILAREATLHWEFRGLPGQPADAALRALEPAKRRALARLRRFTESPTIETV
ncbi:MAG: M20/M25/M40 family metallo-hydrolase, partial [Hyphomicrobiales bacterium]|nr:M20/M25/M40 family metallo-hydrolase [Hyphomicrobiales bacterium]